MSDKKRYKDIDLSFKAHPITGDILKKSDDEDIKQSIRNLINTRFYERLDENIGVDLRGMLFQLDTFISKNYIETVLSDVLEYEPRISVNEITVNVTEQNKYKVRISFTIINRTTPIYLDEFLDVVR